MLAEVAAAAAAVWNQYQPSSNVCSTNRAAAVSLSGGVSKSLHQQLKMQLAM
jgi:hypothetical protein